jgi:hypothetical protein
VLATLLALTVLAAPARAEEVLNLVADATNDTGYIELGMIASSDLKDITVGELVDGTVEDERPFPLQPFPNTFPDHQGMSGGTIRRAAQWRCDRAIRTFLATATAPDSSVIHSQFQVRTPSCRNRLTVELPVEVKPGRTVRVKLRDTWTLGDVDAEVCRRPPGDDVTCDAVALEPGQARAVSTFVPRQRARWTVTVVAGLQRVVRPLSVGVKPRPADLRILPQVLATGDSLMQGLDDILDDDLRGRADVTGDVLIGSGLTSDLIQDWDKVPDRQVERVHPDGVVIFLGANDSYKMTTPGGDDVSCCGQSWITEYARRARKVMRTYIKATPKTHVFYLTVPAARDARRNVPGAAVNAGLYAAADGVPRVHILDMVSLFTPGGVWREYMPYRGKSVRVFQDDGIHLSVAGAKIAAEFVIRALSKRGII